MNLNYQKEGISLHHESKSILQTHTIKTLTQCKALIYNTHL